MEIDKRKFGALMLEKVTEEFGEDIADRFALDGKIIYAKSKEGRDEYGVYFARLPDGTIAICFHGGIFKKIDTKHHSNVYRKVRMKDGTSLERLTTFLVKEARSIADENLVQKKSKERAVTLAKEITRMMKDEKK